MTAPGERCTPSVAFAEDLAPASAGGGGGGGSGGGGGGGGGGAGWRFGAAALARPARQCGAALSDMRRMNGRRGICVAIVAMAVAVAVIRAMATAMAVMSCGCD